MTLPRGYHEVRLGPDDQHRATVMDTWAFPTGTDLKVLERLPMPFEWERSYAAVADDDAPDGPTAPLAAIHASYGFSHFPVPGGTAPTAGLTWVGVHPAHRRRGILTAMIDEHLGRSLERGEVLSALYAAETAIYGRFGYGRAADELQVRLPRRAALRPVAGSADHRVRIELVDLERHPPRVEELHRHAAEDVAGTGLGRPGWVTRQTEGLRRSWWSDHPELRRGRESLRVLTVELGDDLRGYALFRRKEDWQPEGPRGTVHVVESAALDAAAAHALWTVLLDMDHTALVVPDRLAPDDPLLTLLVDVRATLPRVTDNLWVRLLDLPAALRARRYTADVDLVLEVTDDRLRANAGLWRLQAGAFGDVSVGRTTADADLSLDVRELAAAYLGAPTLLGAAAAGLVREHTDGALARAVTALGWPVAPFCSWVF